jgi:hypothetical protein
MKRFFLFLLVLSFIGIPAYDLLAATQTINTVPSSNATFITDNATFDEQEDADRDFLRGGNSVIKGGLSPTSANLTAIITEIVAFPNGFYVTQAATSHTYTASKRTFVYVRDDDSRTITISGATITYDSHFVFAETTASTEIPDTPTGTLPLFYADTGAVALSTVIDLRSGYVDAKNFDDLEDAADNVGANQTIVISDVQNVGTKTITQDVWIAPGGRIIVADNTTLTTSGTLSIFWGSTTTPPIDGTSTGGNTDTLTVNGGFISEPSLKVIGSDLTVTGMSKVEYLSPNWWVVNTTPGTTDMTDAFTAMATLDRPIKLLPESYVFNTVAYSAGDVVIIHGAGQGLSTLLHKASATASMLEADAAILEYFELKDLTIDGNSSNITDRTISPIDVQAKNLLIKDCEITNSIKAGIRLRGITYKAIIENNWIHDMAAHSTVAGEDTTAILINKDYDSDGVVWVINNKIEQTSAPVGAGNSIAGIVVNPDASYEQETHILHNTLRYMGQAGAHGNNITPIQIYQNGSGSVIDGNKIFDSYWGGIKVQRSSHVKIINNIIDGEGTIYTGTESPGINISGRSTVRISEDILVQGNSVTNVPTMSGGIICNFDSTGEVYNLQIRNNYIDNVDAGISVIYPLESLIIDGNIIENINGGGANEVGIRIANLSATVHTDVKVTNNIIQDVTTKQGVFSDGGTTRLADILFQGNTIDNVGANAVTLREFTRVQVIGNTWKGDPSGGTLDVENNAFVVVSGNVATNWTLRNVSNTAYISDGTNSWESEIITADGATLNTGGYTDLDSTSNKLDSTQPNGTTIGQTKTIVMSEASNASDVSITKHQTSDPEVCTFNAVDETGVFMWTGTEWITIFATCTF